MLNIDKQVEDITKGDCRLANNKSEFAPISVCLSEDSSGGRIL
jgi:hypothetical protein